jgi:hypothetical protein
MQNTSNNDSSVGLLKKLWSRFIEEPLLIFTAIAVLIFLGDYLISLTKNDPKAIVITPEIREDIKQIYINSLKREPTPVDMKILIDRWVDNEVLYREGLALGLDKGDSSIRERVIFKTLSVTQAEITLPKLNDNDLQKWFTAHEDQYDSPALINFEEAVVSGKPSKDDLTNFINALNGKGHSSIDSSLEIFKDRPRFTIVDGYGEEFTNALEKLTLKEWVSLDSKMGTRVVRLIGVKPGDKASFEPLKTKVYTDWKNQTAAELSTKAIRELGKKYKIIDQGAKQ